MFQERVRWYALHSPLSRPPTSLNRPARHGASPRATPARLPPQYLPSLYVIGAALVATALKAWTALAFLVLCPYISWVYLRFFQLQPETTLRGDPSEEFKFSSFFPDAVAVGCRGVAASLTAADAGGCRFLEGCRCGRQGCRASRGAMGAGGTMCAADEESRLEAKLGWAASGSIGLWLAGRPASSPSCGVTAVCKANLLQTLEIIRPLCCLSAASQLTKGDTASTIWARLIATSPSARRRLKQPPPLPPNAISRCFKTMQAPIDAAARVCGIIFCLRHSPEAVAASSGGIPLEELPLVPRGVGGGVPLPGDSSEASRRRERGAKALEERLKGVGGAGKGAGAAGGLGDAADRMEAGNT